MRERYAEFTSLIMNINRYIQRIKNAEMKKFGLKGNQVQCIFYLFKKEGGLNSGQLAEFCEEDKAAISRTLKGLKQKELVYLEDSNEKKYRKLYKLTDRGYDLAKAVVEKTDGFVEKASRGLDEKSSNKLYESLGVISENLKNLSYCGEEQ